MYPSFKWICFICLLVSCKDHHTKPSLSNEKKVVIGILPYKGFDTSLLSFVQKEIEAFYPCETIFLESTELPANAFYLPRNRYRADSLLIFETRFVNDYTGVIVGLTDRDISVTKDNVGDWGVFGFGYCPGRACVISSKRLLSKDNNQFKERLIKVILHELGHNFGLPHCANNPECLMNDAKGKMETVEKEKKWLCDKCKTKLLQ